MRNKSQKDMVFFTHQIELKLWCFFMNGEFLRDNFNSEIVAVDQAETVGLQASLINQMPSLMTHLLLL